MCICGSTHRYYPAAWLVPVVMQQMGSAGNAERTDQATAHSLANLVRNSGWPVDLLRTSPEVVALLKALRVGVPELIMECFAADDEEREALDETLAQLLTSVGSDWDRLQALADDIQEDGELFDHLEERRERRRRVRENQRLGALVEGLVRESLEGEGFDVRRTGVGSDFSIQPRLSAEDEEIRLELTRRGRTWLVEIKSARDDSVRMTSVQARASVKHNSNYLLCVVPINSGPEDPDAEAVRRSMRFVDGIGGRLSGICTDLDDFESFRESVTVEDAQDSAWSWIPVHHASASAAQYGRPVSVLRTSFPDLRRRPAVAIFRSLSKSAEGKGRDSGADTSDRTNCRRFLVWLRPTFKVELARRVKLVAHPVAVRLHAVWLTNYVEI